MTKVDYNILYGSIDLILIVLLICIFFIKYGLKHKPSIRYEYFMEFPDDMYPAEVNAYLRHNGPENKALIATILDLSSRGFLKFETDIKKSHILKRQKITVAIKVIKKDDISIKKYERDLLAFIEKCNESCSDVKQYINTNKEYTHYFMREWKRHVRESVHENFPHYFEDPPWGVNTVLLTLSTLNVLWAAISCIKKEFITLAFIFPVIIISLLSFKILKRKSQKGIDSEYCWKIFKKSLKEFSQLDSTEIPEISKWERYLIYAEALGMTKHVLKQLPVVYPEVKEAYYGSWFNYYGFMYGEADIIQAFSCLNAFIESLSKSWNLPTGISESLKIDQESSIDTD